MGKTEQGGFKSPEEAAAAAKFNQAQMDYSKAAVLEPSVGKFFGSEKSGHVKEIANIMSRQENPLPGHMLDEMIQFALSNPTADRNETSTHLMSKFNYDGKNGEEFPLEKKQEALRTVMNFFDDLQEMRGKIIEKQKEMS